MLLEEPQAAFYAWTAQVGRQWRNAVSPGDIVLVCDIGGGSPADDFRDQVSRGGVAFEKAVPNG